MKTKILIACTLTALVGSPASLEAQRSSTLAPFVGTWLLQAADVVHPDGRRESDYGAPPKGLLMIDAGGRYSLQIIRQDRPHFASGDRAKGTPQEYAAAVTGTSTHFGTISVDRSAHVLTFTAEAASFPNQDGTTQRRSYELHGPVLSYKVAPRPNGDVPISIWRKAG